MRQKKGSLIFLAVLLLFVYFSAIAFSAGAFDVQTVGQEERVAIAGSIEEVGRGFIVINGFRLGISENTQVFGKDGTALRDGVQGLRKGQEVEALVEREVILKIRLVELLR